MSAHRHRPQLETLEGRALLAAGHVPHAFLFTPIPEGTPLAEHIHPHLTIIINGQTQTIPAGIGLGPTGNLPIHTHTSEGTLHIESTQQLPFRLGDFFAIWGEPFNRHDILGHMANRHEKITMTIDGRPSRQFGNVLLQDGQDIVIRYGPK